MVEGRVVFRRRFLSGGSFVGRCVMSGSFVDIHFRNIIKFGFDVFK